MLVALRRTWRPLIVASVMVVALAPLTGARAAGGTWSATGDLLLDTSAHTATLLGDSRVLVIGGNDFFHQSVTPTEIYDPATGTWSRATDLDSHVTAPLARSPLEKPFSLRVAALPVPYRTTPQQPTMQSLGAAAPHVDPVESRSYSG